MSYKNSNPMLVAINEAEKASIRDEVPVGAAIYDHEHQQIVAKAGNNVRSLNDPTAHAEILAIREACRKTGQSRLNLFSLYVTLEPCPMCCQAISFARIQKLVFGAYDPKGGGVEHGPKIFSQTTCHHNLEILGGIEEQRCEKLLTDFFNKKRQKGSNLKKLLNNN